MVAVEEDAVDGHADQPARGKGMEWSDVGGRGRNGERVLMEGRFVGTEGRLTARTTAASGVTGATTTSATLVATLATTTLAASTGTTRAGTRAAPVEDSAPTLGFTPTPTPTGCFGCIRRATAPFGRTPRRPTSAGFGRTPRLTSRLRRCTPAPAGCRGGTPRFGRAPILRASTPTTTALLVRGTSR